MYKKLAHNPLLRVSVELLLGLLISVLLCSVFIFFGYTTFYQQDLMSHTVDILGLPIYVISLHDNTAHGSALGQNMFIVNLLCAGACAGIAEICFYLKRPKVQHKNA